MSHTKLLELIESAKEELTHTIPDIRIKAIENITEYMETHDRIYWYKSLPIVTEFLISKFADKYTLSCAVAGLIFCIDHLKLNETLYSCDPLIFQLLNVKDISIQQEPQPTRNSVYKLYTKILEHFEPILFQKTLYRDQFLENVLDMFDGEKDPRNLLLHFKLYTMISKSSILEGYDRNEDILHAVLCYFPITFTPPSNDKIGITTEDLQNSLNTSISSMLPYTWEWTLQAIMDRLGSSHGKHNAKEVISLVTNLLPMYHAPFLMQNAESIGQDLMQELWLDRIDHDLLCSKAFLALIDGVYRAILSLNICESNTKEFCSPLKELIELVIDKIILLMNDSNQRKHGRVKSLVFLINNMVSSTLLTRLSCSIIEAINRNQMDCYEDNFPWMILGMLLQETFSKDEWKSPSLLNQLYDLIITTLRSIDINPLSFSSSYVQVVLNCLTNFIGPVYFANIIQLKEIHDMLIRTNQLHSISSKAMFILASNHKEFRDQIISDWISKWWNSHQDWSHIWQEFISQNEWSEYITGCIINNLISHLPSINHDFDQILQTADILYNASRLVSLSKSILLPWISSYCNNNAIISDEKLIYQLCRITGCLIASMNENEQSILVQDFKDSNIRNDIKTLLLYVILPCVKDSYCTHDDLTNAILICNSNCNTTLKWYTAKYIATYINRNEELQYHEFQDINQDILYVFLTKAIVLKGLYSEYTISCIRRVLRNGWLENLPFSRVINPFHLILDKNISGVDHRLYHCKKKPWYLCGFLQNTMNLLQKETLLSFTKGLNIDWLFIAGIFTAIPDRIIMNSLSTVLPILKFIFLNSQPDSDKVLIQIMKLWIHLFDTKSNDKSMTNNENFIEFMDKILYLCDYRNTRLVSIRCSALELLSSWNNFLISSQYTEHTEKIIRFLGTLLDDPKRKSREKVTKIRNSLILRLDCDNTF